MSVATNIIGSWYQPRVVMRQLLAAGQREDRALVYLMTACGLMFVAQWPGMARAAHFDPSVPLDARMGASLLALLFIAPPVFYLLAAASHGAARLLGGRGSFYGARLALFWALLAAIPAILLQGLVAGFIGKGPALWGSGIVVLAGFLMIWGGCLWVAETEGAE